MTYRSAKAEKRSKHIRIATLVVFILLVSFFWGPTQSLLYPILSPFVSTYVAIRDTGTGVPHFLITYFTSRNTYEKKIGDLEQHIEFLENELAYAHMLTEDIENKETETSSATTTDSFYRGGVSQKLFPLVKDITTIYNTILVSGGFDDGLEEGQVVFVRGYQAVGYIAKVHKNASVVNLYSSYGEKVDGVIKDIDTTVTLLGDGGGVFRIEVPKSVDLAVGQTVYLASDHKMTLGTIVDVSDDPQDTFIEAYVRGSYNPNKAHIFYVDHQ